MTIHEPPADGGACGQRGPGNPDRPRRAWLAGAAGFVVAPGLRHAALIAGAIAAAPVQAAVRSVDDLSITLDLPDDWIPIPRAEIVEATDRARSAGAATDWTLRAAWQRVPHQRWFTLPHLLLESQAATDGVAQPLAIAHTEGRAGPRTVYTHQARWSRNAVALRLTLLSWEDERPRFEAWVAGLRDSGRPLAGER